MRGLFCDVRYVRNAFGMVSWVRISVRRRRMEVRARFRCCEVLSLRERVIRSEVVRMVGLADPGVWHTHAPVYENRLSVSRIRLSYPSVRAEAMRCDIAQHGIVHCRPQTALQRAYPTNLPDRQSRQPSGRVFLPS
jgi:hypothetical protein